MKHLSLSVLIWETQVMKKIVYRAIISDNAVFAGFSHVKFCSSGEGFFELFCFAYLNKDNLI